jgi:hypothetical protein
MSDAAETLSCKLTSFLKELDPYETENYKLLMAMAAGKLAPLNGSQASGDRAAALRAALGTIAEIGRSDVIWRGRPPFLTEELMAELRRESREARRRARRNDQYWMEFGGPVARAVAQHPELTVLLGERGVAMEPAGCMYVYYMQPGDRVDPHVDEYEHSLNGILMIEHEHQLAPSHLLLFHPGKPAERVLLTSGEMVVIDGGGLVHAREPIQEGETISLLTLGFKPRTNQMGEA